jgi:hypothetical protein
MVGGMAMSTVFKKLVQHTIGCTDAMFIPLLDGISGTIGALTIDENYEHDTMGILIDTLMVDLTNQVDDDDDISVTDSTVIFALLKKQLLTTSKFSRGQQDPFFNCTNSRSKES